MAKPSRMASGRILTPRRWDDCQRVVAALSSHEFNTRSTSSLIDTDFAAVANRPDAAQRRGIVAPNLEPQVLDGHPSVAAASIRTPLRSAPSARIEAEWRCPNLSQLWRC